VLYDPNIIGTSSDTFGYLRQSSVTFGRFSENVRGRSSSLRNNFGKSLEIFGKWTEIFGNSPKTSLLVCLYNKQNNTWTLGDMEFIFSCSHSISHSFASLTRSISMLTLEDRFHFSARPCIILYYYQYTRLNGKSASSKHTLSGPQKTDSGLLMHYQPYSWLVLASSSDGF